MVISEKTYNKMPIELKKLFNKLPNQSSEEVLRLFPETKSVQSYRGLQHSGRHGGLSDLGGNIKEGTNSLRGHNDSGSASRFFYSAKASKSERNAGLEGFEEKRFSPYGYDKGLGNAGEGMFKDRNPKKQNNHPTVKPVSLMRYLCRLITPKNGTVLDPFMGSGSTGIGAVLEGFNFVGIEREKEYCEIAEARIEHYKDKLKLAL
jgi:site-specific DNA-methyltransferase (adenine-specific)